MLNQPTYESENPWKLALESSGEGIWDWNMLTGAQSHSVRWEEMLGYQAGELNQGYQEFICLLYTSPSPRDRTRSRMPSSA